MRMAKPFVEFANFNFGEAALSIKVPGYERMSELVWDDYGRAQSFVKLLVFQFVFCVRLDGAIQNRKEMFCRFKR